MFPKNSRERTPRAARSQKIFGRISAIRGSRGRAASISPPASAIRLLIDKSTFSSRRAAARSRFRERRRQSAFLHVPPCDKFTDDGGPLICRTVISSLTTTTRRFWSSGSQLPRLSASLFRPFVWNFAEHAYNRARCISSFLENVSPRCLYGNNKSNVAWSNRGARMH